MINKRLFSLFSKASSLKQSVIATAPSLNDFSVDTPNLTKNSGSSLVRNLLSDDRELMQHYENYLIAYNKALSCLADENYKQAKLQADEAFSNLTVVDTITAALGKDFGKITALINFIDERIPKKDNKHY